jgi:hypothetical protein
MLSTTLIDPKIQARANTSTEWLNTDTLHRYVSISTNSHNPYSRYDIEYKFNSHGFRCDEFDIPSELPIVFLGCSFTEGIGLRQQETWSYLLLEKIRQKTNKNIPYWNLGIAGTGLDTQARNLYFLSNILNKKIKFVFSLMPPIARREYKAEGNEYKKWLPMQITNSHPLSTHVNTLFIDSDFSTHQAERSLMTIDSICRQNDTKMYCTSWENYPNNVKPLFDSFPLINFFEKKFYSSGSFARDGRHPGPRYHQKLADVYWQHVEKYFTDIPNI